MSFTFCDDPEIARATRGLVPYRLRRRPGVPMDANDAEAWAVQQPWFNRVRARRSTVSYFTWFVSPETPEEMLVLEQMAGTR